jgi:transcriptional accessory protein Tex/SPT6
MASQATLDRLSAEFDSPPEHIAAAVALIEEKASPAYIAHYRRAAVGNMNEDRLCAISERVQFLNEQEQRKTAILEQAKERGTLTAEFEQTVRSSVDQDFIDDLYQSIRPRRRTAAVQLEEKGLLPLVLAIQHRQLGELSLTDAAQQYVSAEQGLPDVEAVLDGVATILAERMSADPATRARCREELRRGVLRARVTNPGKGGAERYRQFFSFAEPIGRIPTGRMLALRRAEREGILELELGLEERRHRELLRTLHAPDLPAYPAAPKKRRSGRRKDSGDQPNEETPHQPDAESQDPAEAAVEENATTEVMAAEASQAEAVAVNSAGAAAAAEEATTSTGDEGAAPAAEEATTGTDGEGAAPAAEEATTGTDDEGAAPAADPDEPAAAEDAPTSAAESESAPTEPTSGEAPPEAADPKAPIQSLADLYTRAFDMAWTTGLRDACGRDVRRRIKEKADREAVRTYARNLRSQLLAPPLGEKKVLTIRTSSKTIWYSMVDEQGSIGKHGTLPMNQDTEREAALIQLKELIGEQQPAAVAVPHGRRQASTERLIEDLRNTIGAEEMPMVVPVDEAASAIFATSQAGRKALPSVEVGVRTGISLARRLQDPLRELLRMDFRSLGLGQTLDDVHQGMLRRELDSIAQSCVAEIGVDLNSCDASLLASVPSLNAELAKNILDHRKKLGGYQSRAQLAEVHGLSEQRVRHVAGFLRIHGGSQPLDQTALHPDDYPIAEAVADQKGCSTDELIGQELRDVQIDPLVHGDIDKGRIIGVLQTLRAAGSDPRGKLTATANAGVHTLADLHADMELRGRIANLTEFGAFVDLGIGQDGLVHISQIPGHRLRDPNQMLRVGEVVQVWVLHVDNQTRKISLSMHKPRHLAEGRPATLGERMDRGKRQSRQRSSGRGPGRGRREQEAGPDSQTFTRGARAPDSRRGQRRSAPVTAEGKPTGNREEGGDRPPRDRGARGPRGDRRGGDRGDRGDRGGRGGRGDRSPRVITVESEREVSETKGHKGELTSLSSLKSLLGKPPANEPSKKEGA